MSETAPEFQPRNPNQVGGVDKKWWIIGGIGAAAVVYIAYKHSQNSAASTSTTAGVDPNTGLPYSSTSGNTIDPTTGYTYGSEYSAPYPQNAIDPNTGIPFSLEGPIDPTTGIPYSQEHGTPTGVTVLPISTNPSPNPRPKPDPLSDVTVIGTDPVTGAPIEIVTGRMNPDGGTVNVSNHPAPITRKTTSKPTKPKPDAPVPYTAVKTDTLSKIEKRFGDTLAQLQKLNPKLHLTKKSKVHKGEIIKV